MADNQVSFEYINSVTPPRGLFPRIMERLGLEKELGLTKKKIVFFALFFVVFLFLLISGFIGLKHELAESSFGQFILLVFSDPSVAVIYWHSLMLSIFESIPSFTVSILLFSLAFFLIFIRLAVFAIERLLVIIKLIYKQKYEYK